MPLIFLLTKNTPRSNFKIKSIMNEKDFLSLKMIANILNQMYLECKLSPAFFQLTAEHALYEDSRNVVRLRDKICHFISFLDTATEYAKIAERG